MWPYLKLFRIYNILIAIVAVLIASYIVDWHNIILLIYAIMAVTLSMVFGNVLNDLLDIGIDQISHPNRPLALDQISRSTTKKILFCIVGLILILSIFLSDIARFYLLIIVLPLLTSYNYFFKKLPIIGNVIISFLLASVFIFTEILFFQKINVVLIPSLLVFSFSFLRELLKDIHDYDGDKQYNMMTFPIIMGRVKSIQVVRVLIASFGLLLLLPYYLHYYNIYYLISVIILIEIPLIILLSLLLRNPDKLTLKQATVLMKVINVLGLVVILIANN